MSQFSGFFDAKKIATDDGYTYDRVYHADDFADYFYNFITDGIFPVPTNGLQVLAKTGKTITVKKGKAFIEGYWYFLDDDIDLTLSDEAGTSTTKIACTLIRADRTIQIVKTENTDPTPINNDVKHELVLAYITSSLSDLTITQSMITDTRADTAYCGMVTGVVEQIDVGTLMAQMQDSFNTWFENIKGQLSTDAAANLQLQINELVDEFGSGGALEQSITAVGNRVTVLEQKEATSSDYTMLASSWNATSKRYSFETRYPVNTYDIDIEPSDTCTDAQLKAWSAAQIVGSRTTNTCKAYGDIPTVDIPIILTVRKRVVS